VCFEGLVNHAFDKIATLLGNHERGHSIDLSEFMTHGFCDLAPIGAIRTTTNLHQGDAEKTM
jgi:hypothetical protein